MKWYDNAVFYHIYPLGLCGCSHENTAAENPKFDKIKQWTKHAEDIGCTAVYIGPLFESQGHGYETTDYYKVDRRLGDNDDFREYVSYCHSIGVKVVVDGVFNHVGRDFFAFIDLLSNRERSAYKDWFCNVDFGGNNGYNDGLRYDNWGGYDLLVKLNLMNPAVKDHLFGAVKMWIDEFDIDGIRLDAADVLDHDFMRALRQFTDSMKKDFWLMGEVIHGNYSMWANDGMLHSVTNYELHKALYSGHNDKNYFEIAHNVKRMIQNCGGAKLYTFADNHDVSRIASKLKDRRDLYPLSVLVYALPGIPSIYYGSEFAIDGEKQRGDDWNLRPDLTLDEMQDGGLCEWLTMLGRAKRELPELSDGEYRELYLRNRQFAFARVLGGSSVIAAVNNDDQPASFSFRLPVDAKNAYDILKSYSESDESDSENESEAPDLSKFDKAISTAVELLAGIKAIDSEESAQTAIDIFNSLGEQLCSAQKECFKKRVSVSLSEDNEIKLQDGNIEISLPAHSGTLIKTV